MKPLRAWAVVAPNGQVVLQRSGQYYSALALFNNQQDADSDADVGEDLRVARVRIVEITKPKRKARK